ncbi:nitroreductase family deazaflavin-dependent oxidoreductase [Prauserella sp. PE36]|uniref:nitroreductase family deazaflavin-dependent oxidoreductase n=1 Tax=Prauserella sp. PE36 TaxID=1504709 RepID=UPI000DE53330|nr:nitroreductase family deazaflavin-dependent oxidoreductase [Prauserella sp. PE36]RBM21578.1 nitroreductase family deazaflavin-dependent oxidoreductase [Prauserella sp. PE36]
MPLPAARPRALDSPLLPKVFRWMSRCHVWAYRRSGGRVGYHWRVGAALRKPAPTLLLDHRGRRSGRVFTTPLIFLRDGADVVVVASQGGRPEHPQWYRNLLSSPDTTVQIKGDLVPVRARTADAAERDALWPLLLDLYADFGTYQSWTSREIPVMILEPR